MTSRISRQAWEALSPVARLVAATRSSRVETGFHRPAVIRPKLLAHIRKVALVHGIDFPVPVAEPKVMREGKADKLHLSERRRPDRQAQIAEGIAKQDELIRAHRESRKKARDVRRAHDRLFPKGGAESYKSDRSLLMERTIQESIERSRAKKKLAMAAGLQRKQDKKSRNK